MEVSFDYLNRATKPQMFVCNPDKTILEIIPQQCVFDTNKSVEFNAVSSLSFCLYKFMGKDENGENVECKCYKHIAKRRKVLVDGLGYFRISSVKEKDDGHAPYYQIECISSEIEWSDKTLYLQAGTYKFYDSSSPSTSLFGKILGKFPDWTLNHIDSTVAERYRTFDYTDEQVYNFVMDTLEKTYECVVDFDYLNYKVNVYDMNNLLSSNEIMISYDNFLEDAEITYESDDVVTALYLTGASDLQVAGVNPMGGNVIYNFAPYMTTDWMSQSLITAIQTWQNKIQSNQSAFSVALTNVTTAQGELNTLNGQLVNLNGQLDVAEQQKALEMSTNQDYSEVSATIATLKTNIANKESEIAAKKSQLDGYKTARSNIQTSLSFESNFTAAQRSELNAYIFQASYSEDNLAVTDSMTWSEQTEIAQQLYNKGIKLLAQLSDRRMEVSIDCANFLNIKDFSIFRSQFKTGKLVTIKPSNGQVYSMLLLGYSIDDDDNLTVKLGNRYRSNDSYKRYGDLYQSITSTANTVDMNKADWSYGIKSGKINEAYNFSKSALNATNNVIKTSDDEEMMITRAGIIGKVKNQTTGEYDPEQLRITHNAILLSEDGFETANCAVGKITMPDGKTCYGVVGDYIVGNIIIGNQLKLANSSGTFSVDEDGLHSTQLDESIGSLQSQIEQTNSNITNQVSHIQETTDGINASITTLQTKSDSVSIDIKNIKDNGVDKVVTKTGYSFDENGLDITKSGEEMHNTLDHTGMYVKRDDDVILQANNNGVEAENVTVRTYLIVGNNSRLEDYGTNRTGIFYIGGDS